MEVAVAVVSYNTRELLLRCLRSLEGDVRAGRAQVVVIDNASRDGSAAAARAQAPWAEVFEPGENLGFGRAVNLVARRTDSSWLLALNADVALDDGALEALLRAGADACTGCVAPRLILPDDSTQHSVHPLPTLPLVLAFNLGLHRVSRRAAERLCLEGFWDPERARVVPWAIGACLLLRRRAFDAVGGFDERQWLYAEDLDLGWRLRDRAWRTRYEPAARVSHNASAATAAAFGAERASRFMAATYAMLARRRGRLRMWLTAAINIAGSAARGPASADAREWLRAHLRGVRQSSTLLRPP